MNTSFNTFIRLRRKLGSGVGLSLSRFNRQSKSSFIAKYINYSEKTYHLATSLSSRCGHNILIGIKFNRNQ